MDSPLRGRGLRYLVTRFGYTLVGRYARRRGSHPRMGSGPLFRPSTRHSSLVTRHPSLALRNSVSRKQAQTPATSHQPPTTGLEALSEFKIILRGEPAPGNSSLWPPGGGGSGRALMAPSSRWLPFTLFHAFLLFCSWPAACGCRVLRCRGQSGGCRQWTSLPLGRRRPRRRTRPRSVTGTRSAGIQTPARAKRRALTRLRSPPSLFSARTPPPKSSRPQRFVRRTRPPPGPGSKTEIGRARSRTHGRNEPKPETFNVTPPSQVNRSRQKQAKSEVLATPLRDRRKSKGRRARQRQRQGGKGRRKAEGRSAGDGGKRAAGKPKNWRAGARWPSRKTRAKSRGRRGKAEGRKSRQLAEKPRGGKRDLARQRACYAAKQEAKRLEEAGRLHGAQSKKSEKQEKLRARPGAEALSAPKTRAAQAAVPRRS